CTPPHLHSVPTRRSSDLITSTGNRIQAICMVRPRCYGVLLHFWMTWSSKDSPKRVADITLLILFHQQIHKFLFAYLSQKGFDIQDRKSTRLNSSHVKISY